MSDEHEPLYRLEHLVTKREVIKLRELAIAGDISFPEFVENVFKVGLREVEILGIGDVPSSLRQFVDWLEAQDVSVTPKPLRCARLVQEMFLLWTPVRQKDLEEGVRGVRILRHVQDFPHTAGRWGRKVVAKGEIQKRGRHPALYLIKNAPGTPRQDTSHLIALPMLAEHLSERRLLLPPGFRWRKSYQYLRDLDWYLDRLDRFSRPFTKWLESGEAFVELPDEELIPEIWAACSGFKVDIRDIANVLGEKPYPLLTPEEYRDRARLYWHLCGMSLKRLGNCTRVSEEDLQTSILIAFRKLLGQIGFQVFAHQVDVSCIIGGATTS